MPGTNFFSKATDTLDIALIDDTGLAHLAKCLGAPPTTAGVFSHGCIINRTDSGTGVNAVYQNTGSSAVPVWTLIDTALGGGATVLVDSNGVTAVSVGTTASAVNGLKVTDSATGSVSANAVAVAPAGTDAAISLTITPKAATGILTLGLPTGTGDVILGLSSGAQSVRIADGAGAAAVSIGNTTTAGAAITIASAATATGNTDTVSIGGGNSAGTGAKIISIATGTPATSGNNKVLIGGGVTSAVTINAAVRSYQPINYIASETGANNAIVGALLNASGAAVTLAAGLRVLVKLAHTLQAGANTFNLNAGGTVSIKSHNNAATDIGTAYASTGVIDLFYDGSAWLDMSQ